MSNESTQGRCGESDTSRILGPASATRLGLLSVCGTRCNYPGFPGSCESISLVVVSPPPRSAGRNGRMRPPRCPRPLRNHGFGLGAPLSPTADVSHSSAIHTMAQIKLSPNRAADPPQSRGMFTQRLSRARDSDSDQESRRTDACSSHRPIDGGVED